MKLCIIGGGKVGFHLAKTLIANGHSPIIIEENKHLCEKIANSLDIRVVHGDGTNLDIMELANINHYHAVIAVTGLDENNLIACQLAKKVFGVKRTIARVNNPKNTEIMKHLGVDLAVSTTDNIARILGREAETEQIRQLMSLDGGTTSLTEVIIPDAFPFAKMTLKDMPVPDDVVIVSIQRKGELIVPRGTTTIEFGDTILVMAKNTAFHNLTSLWKLLS
ncbi:MAG: NAD-binding protein [Oscillospiraceae bacterium]